MTQHLRMRPLLLACLLANFANAVEMDFSASNEAKNQFESDSPSVFSLPFTGELSLTAEYFSQESPNEPDTDGYISGYLKLHKSGQLTDSLQYVLTPKVYFHSGDRVDSDLEFIEDSTQRPTATVEEVYVTWLSGEYEFQVGKLIKTWGVGDAFKPNDVINPHDFLSVPDHFKIGVPAISGYKHGDLFDINVILIPFFTPSRLPQMDSRWATDTQQASLDYFNAFGMMPTFVDDGRDLPSNSVDNMQYGLNLSSSTLIEGWDLGLYFYRGFRSTGAIRQRIAPPVLGIEIVYPEFRQYGGSFSTTWEQFEFHGEFAYQDTKNNRLGDDYWNYIAGFNYTLDDSIPLGIESIVFVLEYAGESVTKDKATNSSFTETSFTRPFPNTVFAKVKVKVSEDTEIECGGALNINDDDYAIGASLKHTLWDSLNLEVGVNIFEGKHSSFYGGWDENDQVYTSLTYYF